jgi:hypothetical protein
MNLRIVAPTGHARPFALWPRSADATKVIATSSSAAKPRRTRTSYDQRYCVAAKPLRQVNELSNQGPEAQGGRIRLGNPTPGMCSASGSTRYISRIGNYCGTPFHVARAADTSRGGINARAQNRATIANTRARRRARQLPGAHVHRAGGYEPGRRAFVVRGVSRAARGRRAAQCRVAP